MHYGLANCNQWVLKLLSYLTPQTAEIEWDQTPPQAIDGTPILTEQDNRGCVKFAFNPVVQGKMTNKCISMAFIRESIALRSTPGVAFLGAYGSNGKQRDDEERNCPGFQETVRYANWY